MMNKLISTWNALVRRKKPQEPVLLYFYADPDRLWVLQGFQINVISWQADPWGGGIIIPEGGGILLSREGSQLVVKQVSTK